MGMEELLRKIENDLARAKSQKDDYYIKIFSRQIEEVKGIIKSEKERRKQ